MKIYETILATGDRCDYENDYDKYTYILPRKSYQFVLLLQESLGRAFLKPVIRNNVLLCKGCSVRPAKQR